MSIVHDLTTWRTCEQVEARDTAENPLTWRIDPSEFSKYHDDDGAVVTSADGYVFIGHITEADDYNGRIYVELS